MANHFHRLCFVLLLWIFYFLSVTCQGSYQNHHNRRTTSKPPENDSEGVISPFINTTTLRPDNNPKSATTARISNGRSIKTLAKVSIAPSITTTTRTTTASPATTTKRRAPPKTTTKSRSRSKITTTKLSRKSITTTTRRFTTPTTTTTSTTTIAPTWSNHHKHEKHGQYSSKECKLHPERCIINTGKPPKKNDHHGHSNSDLPPELRNISWSHYIHKSTLKLPSGERTANVSPDKAHNLAFGSPDIEFQTCTLPGDRYTVEGRCRFLQYCARPEIIASLEAFLKFSCIIGDEKNNKELDILGVCCPSEDDDDVRPTYTVKPTTPRSNGGNKVTTTTTRSPQVSGCGTNNVPASRIVGGQKVDVKGKFPWMAALLRDRWDQYCGGALISNRHILTASHCVDNFKPSQVMVRLGESNMNSAQASPSRQDVAVSAIFMHERYDPVTYLNDIAILQLKEKITNWTDMIRPICIATEPANLEGKMATVAGWGLKSEADRTGSTYLMEVDVPIMGISQCQKSYNDLQLPIVKEQICAGYAQGGKDSCSGDSGGPLMLQTDLTRSWNVIGVVSWGVGCAQKGRPGVYTRVESYYDWIQSKMALK